MSYKIVVDSCCDLTDEMRKWDNLAIVPLTLQINDYCILDDENFQQDDFISRMKANGGIAKSACPAPDAFKEAYEGDYDDVYVLTITDKLSGTYNSALQGKMLYEEEFGKDKNIYVFNSLATSGIETMSARKIKALADSGEKFDDIVKAVDDFIVNRTELYFCLESLDALKKNGRLFALAANVLEKIRIKLICKRTQEGNISLVAQDLTINRAMVKMANIIAEKLDGKDLSNETLIISYVCCEERAKLVAQKISDKVNFGKVEILKASGLNSLYASDGGIIVSYSF
ncbi:MAG: DegV family protein [Eubacterium sp.]